MGQLLRIAEYSVNSSSVSFRAKLRYPQDSATQSRNLLFTTSAVKAGFSTPQDRPRADNPGVLEMTELGIAAIFCNPQ
jgi:hypothetical protein